jgi:hypothetical protein
MTAVTAAPTMEAVTAAEQIHVSAPGDDERAHRSSAVFAVRAPAAKPTIQPTGRDVEIQQCRKWSGDVVIERPDSASRSA